MTSKDNKKEENFQKNIEKENGSKNNVSDKKEKKKMIEERNKIHEKDSRKEKNKEENDKKEKKSSKGEMLGKAPENKFSEEDAKRQIVLDWKNLLNEGFSLERFREGEKKEEGFSLEGVAREAFKPENKAEIKNNYSNRGYLDKQEDKYLEYSPPRRRDFSFINRDQLASIGKLNPRFESSEIFFDRNLGDFIGFEEQNDYSPPSFKMEKFSRESKTFSQFEREGFEGIKRKNRYREISFRKYDNN